VSSTSLRSSELPTPESAARAGMEVVVGRRCLRVCVDLRFTLEPLILASGKCPFARDALLMVSPALRRRFSGHLFGQRVPDRSELPGRRNTSIIRRGVQARRVNRFKSDRRAHRSIPTRPVRLVRLEQPTEGSVFDGARNGSSRRVPSSCSFEKGTSVSICQCICLMQPAMFEMRARCTSLSSVR